MKVIKKQTNSKMCIICGIENESSVKARFYEMEDQSLITLFKFREFHQSYPQRTHGGLITALLDEAIGRCIWIYEPDTWGVTATLNIKFRKPVPYDQELKAVSWITENKKRTFTGEGRIYLGDEVLAEATCVYVKLPLSKIASENHEDINIYIEDDIKEIN